ncbi:hypothetical protein GCM10007147_42600 [Nocardiopsis kunsanensis]|uniref:Uncharacterized protein n=1 Tax=Nocardiopsis kunsanensis TaxID=141693 RepID=A0A918XJX5_9ACTN|nr:hypothetical protein [Nocardiopsis kunsanensis]GHD35845.1 hypothetical protein GCM10007147_42600 [Nocardiopsis kunsanensis]
METLSEDLDACCAQVLDSVPRKDTCALGNCCPRGSIQDGQRKSVPPVAQCLSDGNL